MSYLSPAKDKVFFFGLIQWRSRSYPTASDVLRILQAGL